MQQEETTSTNEVPDISQYENIDLSTLNANTTETTTSEDTLANILTKVVYFSRIGVWVSLGICVFFLLYTVSKYQFQKSWIMKLPLNNNESFICHWMNHGLQRTKPALLEDTPFREFLKSEGKQYILDIIEKGNCRAIDTIADWFDMQKKYNTEILKKAYEDILPKKFIGTTISSSPELNIITNKSPGNRMHHDIVIHVLSETTVKLSDQNARILCNEIRFFDLRAEARCEVFALRGVQPRAKAMEFMDALDQNDSLEVTYPHLLDMYIDSKTGLLKTNFNVQMTYSPSRYEADTLKKLTYEKR